jgi:hypothetical protein
LFYPNPVAQAGEYCQAEADKRPLFPARAGFVLFVFTRAHGLWFFIDEIKRLIGGGAAAKTGGQFPLKPAKSSPRPASCFAVPTTAGHCRRELETGFAAGSTATPSRQ